MYTEFTLQTDKAQATRKATNGKHAKDAVVEIGSRVTVRDLKSDEVETYTLVYPDDANILENRISSFTPAGRALYGKRAGDVVKYDAPAGPVSIRIESVETDPGPPSEGS